MKPIKDEIMDHNDDKKDFIRMGPPNIRVTDEYTRMITMVASKMVATSSELEAKIILPLSESKQRLFRMYLEKVVIKSESKKEIRKLSAGAVNSYCSENRHVKPLKLRLSQTLLDKMKSTISSKITSRVKLPSKRKLPPPASTNAKNRKIPTNRYGRRNPQLGRPFHKKVVQASTSTANCVKNTFRKPPLALSADGDLTEKSTVFECENLSGMKDIENDFGDIKIKVK